MSNNFDPNQNHFVYIKKDSIPLVFIHGVGLDHKMWKPQIENLNEFSINSSPIPTASNCCAPM